MSRFSVSVGLIKVPVQFIQVSFYSHLYVVKKNRFIVYTHILTKMNNDDIVETSVLHTREV